MVPSGDIGRLPDIEMAQTLDRLDDDALITIFAALTIPDIQALRKASMIFVRVFAHVSQFDGSRFVDDYGLYQCTTSSG